MHFILDAQLPPMLAKWLSAEYSLPCVHCRAAGFTGMTDLAIFMACRSIAGSVIVSKDQDFVDLVTRLGTPPQVLLIRAGNMTNAAMQSVFKVAFPKALEHLRSGEPVVEIVQRAGD